ncbi:hypothetical protein DBV15_05639 [Temnothorax longispinosus]|uniref:Uncharacterized protein n=1 Tax=Temnothorax longispinosus TaxID=300112 RepID=A0A4S2JZY1_9HYME|nr:hypothetical protein DBV15_05639 [Temnothorax longispinosus]
MLPDCRRPGSNYTCTNYGGLPRKEQAIRREPVRRLLCVKGAPRCGGARSCARRAPTPLPPPHTPGTRRASNGREAARAWHATRARRVSACSFGVPLYFVSTFIVASHLRLLVIRI